MVLITDFLSHSSCSLNRFRSAVRLRVHKNALLKKLSETVLFRVVGFREIARQKMEANRFLHSKQTVR